MKSPDPTITVAPYGTSIFCPVINWRGCLIRPTNASGNAIHYTTHADAMRGARRALRRLGYVDLWTDTDKQRRAAKVDV